MGKKYQERTRRKRRNHPTKGKYRDLVSSKSFLLHFCFSLLNRVCVCVCVTLPVSFHYFTFTVKLFFFFSRPIMIFFIDNARPIKLTKCDNNYKKKCLEFIRQKELRPMTNEDVKQRKGSCLFRLATKVGIEKYTAIFLICTSD